MPAQVDLSKLSVRQFAERFKSEMIPLSNTFSYFCASVPLSEEDLKEYLEEPVAALPPESPPRCPRSRFCWFLTWNGATERRAKSQRKRQQPR